MIYLDHHAATPLEPEAVRAMDLARELAWANPSSVHAAGRAARALLETARRSVAEAIRCDPADVVLTSGGTEAINTAVLGLVRDPAHVVTTQLEHPAVAEAVARLEARGTRVTRLVPAGGAAPSVDALSAALSTDSALVALQWVNHETGLVLPVAEYAALCRARGVRFVVDASQALGKLPVDLTALGADAVAFAASKVGGPHGAGAVFLARAHAVVPMLAGGGQERGRRPGTPDVRAAVGFGAAATQVARRLAAMPAVARLRDRLEAGLVARGAVVNVARDAARVATVTHVAFEGLRGDVLVAALDVEGVCVSSGAACSSGLAAPSPSILAMFPEQSWRAAGALRFSLGPETTTDEIDGALIALDRVLARLGRGAIQGR